MTRLESWLPVQDMANTECPTAALADLDLSDWYTENQHGAFYLRMKTTDGTKVHRCYCSARGLRPPRLGFRRGELCWIVSARYVLPSNHEQKGDQENADAAGI